MIKWISPQKLSKSWHLADKFLSDAMDSGENLLSRTYVVDELIARRFDLFLIMRDEEVAGAAVTQIMSNARGHFLHVLLAGLDKKPGTLNHMRSEFERVAQYHGMQGIAWSSSDDRWGSWAERAGYRKRFVEYVKEF